MDRAIRELDRRPAWRVWLVRGDRRIGAVAALRERQDVEAVAGEPVAVPAVALGPVRGVVHGLEFALAAVNARRAVDHDDQRVSVPRPRTAWPGHVHVHLRAVEARDLAGADLTAGVGGAVP